MDTTDPPIPGPPTLVDCPWCADPIALDPDGTELVCGGCHVSVDIAADRAPHTRRLAA